LIVFVIIYALVVAGWWARHLFISLIHPLDMDVSPIESPATTTRVSVIVPARNESTRITDCIRTLRDQGPVIGELIVVDDRSTDGTAAVVEAAGEQDSRLRTIRVDTLPEGWAGKAHACHVGGQVAGSHWLLFTDADCRFKPGGVAGAVAYAERRDVDLLTLWLAADHRSFWEHMLIPLCGALILYWFPPLWANRKSSALAFANGQFILIRRDAYLKIGGHAAARSTVIEDIPLAQYAKRNGIRLMSALGPRIVSVRMYSSFAEVWNGWTRIFIGALQRPFKIIFSIWSLIGGSLLPTVGAPAAIIAWAIGAPIMLTPWARWIGVLLVLHFVAVYSVSYRLWALCGCARRYLWLYPLSVVVTAALLARAAWWLATGRQVIWRGSATGRSPR
jgi:glycosyltransferase involved in cell wall biosynthesis